MEGGSAGSDGSAEMYSSHWFGLFADSVDSAVTAGDVSAISRICPPATFPRLLEIGCGNGRVSEPLSAVGFDVTGIDVNVAALAMARKSELHPGPSPVAESGKSGAAPNVRYVLLDQRSVAELDEAFDVAIILWKSIGFTTRDDDVRTFEGLSRVVRSGGRLLVDLYHPDWLRSQSTSTTNDSRGVRVRRWVENARCFHEIIYDDGTVDHIQFNVYQPDEMIAMARSCGFELLSQMTWWRSDSPPSGACARYQLVFARQ